MTSITNIPKYTQIYIQVGIKRFAHFNNIWRFFIRFYLEKNHSLLLT